MDKKTARHIATCLRSVRAAESNDFTMVSTIKQSPLVDFHRWANGKMTEGAFLLRSDSFDVAYWFVLIEWNRTFGYYLVVFRDDHRVPFAEIHDLEVTDGGRILAWTYKPTKHDSRNLDRRDYFERHFLSTVARVSVPESTSDVEPFLNEVFSLIECRRKSDLLDTTHPPEIRRGFPEGKRLEALHHMRERNSAVVRAAKNRMRDKDGHITCQCCGFDFAHVYGARGTGFIEAHHTKPLSELEFDGGQTHIEDIAMVCSNCHRMLHIRRPWLEMDELQELLVNGG